MQHTVDIAGVDEVGMGCIAGPVVAAAVMFGCSIQGDLAQRLDDSKKIRPLLREKIFHDLYRQPQIQIGVAAASVDEILMLNIKGAAFLAMQRAVKKLCPLPQLVIVDGTSAPDFGCAAQPIIKGDGLSFSIAAASIIAKVVRDRLMHRLSKQWQGYGWEKNVGYPTMSHRNALEKQGASPHHRQGFATVKQLSFKINFLKSEAAVMLKDI